MSTADAVARAVLYEGYVLYPYRASSVKNRHRWTFGGLYPRAWCARSDAGDRSSARAKVLVRVGGSRGPTRPTVRAVVRFLHLAAREGDGWQEGEEREAHLDGAALADLAAAPVTRIYVFEGRSSGEGGARHQRTVSLALTLAATRLDDAVFKVTATVTNETALAEEDAPRDQALLASLAAAHVVIAVEGAALVSLHDPPEAMRAFAEGCRGDGLWPVLVGDRARSDAALCAPVILYDFPEVAPESPGDLFDATEIDEILTLRVLTLTDDEKLEVRRTDPRAAALLDRTEALGPEALARLHGALRERGADVLVPGDRVWIRPRRRADVFDLALAGMRATVASVERDLDGARLVTVTVDDDPGKDLGATGEPGHRFFFGEDELERLP